MTLFHWFIYILSQRLVSEVYTRCDNAVFANFVAVISRTNSNWFEFVEQFALSDTVNTVTLSLRQNFVAAISRTSLNSCD